MFSPALTRIEAERRLNEAIKHWNKLQSFEEVASKAYAAPQSCSVPPLDRAAVEYNIALAARQVMAAYDAYHQALHDETKKDIRIAVTQEDWDRYAARSNA